MQMRVWMLCGFDLGKHGHNHKDWEDKKPKGGKKGSS